MSQQSNRKIQYLAGLCVSSNFIFTGATLSWPSSAIPMFRSGEVNVNFKQNQISWLFYLIAVGVVIGCFCGHSMADRAGRRMAVCVGTLPGIVGAAIMMFSKTLGLMYLSRLMSGISLGMTAVVVMIYITEISDKEIRGALGMSVQVTKILGSLIVRAIGPFVSYNTLNAVMLTIPVANLLLCLWIPESPYYHMKDGRIDAARKEFARIKGSNDERWVNEQMGEIRAHVRKSMENKTTLGELLSNKKYRKALYIVVGLKMLQYMTGDIAIQLYHPIIIQENTFIFGPLVSIVYEIAQLLSGVGGAILAGYFGRRILMFISSLGVAISVTAVGIYFYLRVTLEFSWHILDTLAFLPLMGVFGFNIFYSVGIGMLPYVMQAELFPINVKTAASSSATIMEWAMQFAIAKCFFEISEELGLSAVFWCFAIVGYLGLFFIYFFVPETKDKTLEEVQDNMAEQHQKATALVINRGVP